MTDAISAPAAEPADILSRGTVLVLADGTMFEGHGFGGAKRRPARSVSTPR